MLISIVSSWEWWMRQSWPHGVLAARAYSAPALLGGGGGGSTDEEEGQEGNQEPCSRGCMHGESDL